MPNSTPNDSHNPPLLHYGRKGDFALMDTEITLRDLFAAFYMAGASRDMDVMGSRTNEEGRLLLTAKFAYFASDALLAERARRKNPIKP